MLLFARVIQLRGYRDEMHFQVYLRERNAVSFKLFKCRNVVKRCFFG